MMTRAACLSAVSEHQKSRFRMALAAGATTLTLFATAIGQNAFGAEISIDPALQIDALLNSGEFGAAAELVGQQPEEARKDLALKVANAQLQSGNTDAAWAVLPRVQNRRDRVETGAEISRELVNNGGASFMELMYLIQAVTGGEDSWDNTQPGGGTVMPSFSGVHVAPNGVLSRQTREDARNQLSGVSQRARHAMLNTDLETPSQLRLVSLTRLEKEVAQRLASGKPVVDSMRNLAGLSEIQFVLLYPEQNEIVLGGPAEGWKYNEHGRALGSNSQRPTLQLDDLVTVMRTFNGEANASFGCSIDPRPENLKKVNDFVVSSQAKGPLSPAGVRRWANQIAGILGTQDITVMGVPTDSRVARVMVEADYRMKLIGIGQLKTNAQIPDYFQLLAKESSLASGNLDALRWWMTLQCEAIVHSPEGDAFEIRGTGVKCLSENEFLTSTGARVSTGKAEAVNRKFAETFTAKYDELAKADPVFADLQGIFDLAMVAALIQNHQMDRQVNWDRGVFAADGTYQPARLEAPTQTESLVNYRVYHGTDVVLQVAGGVRGDVQSILNDAAIQQESPRLGAVTEKSKAPELPANRWWWDAQK